MPFYPASYDLPNEIAVAAVNLAGQLASFSNFGAGTVALAAPGVNILSTVPGGYAYMSGTSMATPYVSGVVALVAGLHPSDTAPELIQQVESTTKPLPGLAGKTSTGGIVDAARAVGVGRPNFANALRVRPDAEVLTTAPSSKPRDTTSNPSHRRPIERHHVLQAASRHPIATSMLKVTGPSWQSWIRS
jgi:subtilisin family serine protease